MILADLELEELCAEAADLLVDGDARGAPLVPVAEHRAAAVHLQERERETGFELS